MNIKNCTPHAIVINDTTFQSSDILPRVSTKQVEAQDIAGFTCVTQSTGKVEGLPEPQENTFLIVSGMVFGVSDRLDLIAPDTGKTAIRNEKGHIVAVTQFLRKWYEN